MQAISEQKKKTVTSEMSSFWGLYLTFALGGREYGIELPKIRKIVGISTPVPMVYKFKKTEAFSSLFFPKGILVSLPAYVKGMIRLQEKIVPVIDLKLRLGLQETVYTIETCIIIVDNDDKPAGIIVDKLLDVVDVRTADIEELPPWQKELYRLDDEIFIGSVTKNQERKVLLNIDKVLGATSIAYKLKYFESV